ncbi:MAG: FAD-binding oxidoreductase [Ginsengibacter sp.]
MNFDTIVIGKGLIGSAAAKYLSKSGEQVAVIGPDEPANLEEGTVFSSHYDQARIQRILGTDAIWTLLNQQSAAAYPSLQKDSDITFHTPVGCLYVNPHGTDFYLEQIEGLAREFDTSYRLFEDGTSLNSAFPDFNFPASSKGIFEDAPAGFINPRLLIKAQMKVFQKNNGTIINEVAQEIIHGNESITIITKEGNTFNSKKVLVCAGAFTNCFNLLQEKLAFKLKSETIILAKVCKEEAIRLGKLPSLLYEIDTPEIQNIYLIQPIEYPDGAWYCKLGANIPEDIHFDTLEDLQNWFRTSDNDMNLDKLKRGLMKLMPGIAIEKLTTKKCIITRTKHGKPYIGSLGKKGLFVAAGGNGYGAMSSDALGRIAAHLLIQNSFPKEYDEKDFLPIAHPQPLPEGTKAPSQPFPEGEGIIL